MRMLKWLRWRQIVKAGFKKLTFNTHLSWQRLDSMFKKLTKIIDWYTYMREQQQYSRDNCHARGKDVSLKINI